MNTQRTLSFVVSVMLLATFVTEAPALAQPAPISACGTTITMPGSYVLIKNISDLYTNPCITVSASNVTINLNGFTITGNGRGLGILIAGSTIEGLTVRNGKIRNFGQAVIAGTATTVENAQADGCTSFAAFCVSLGSDDLVANDEISIVKHVIGIPGAGGGLSVGINSLVRDSAVNNNSYQSAILACSNAVIVQNTASSSYRFSDGFDVVGGVIARNTAAFTSLYGFVASQKCGDGEASALFTNNLAYGNSQSGIQVDSNSAALIGNTAISNNNNGISLKCPANVVGNTGLNNAGNLVEDTSQGSCNNFNNLAP